MWPWLSSLNALLFSKMSVLSPASTWPCSLLGFTSPPGSSCRLLIPVSFPLLASVWSPMELEGQGHIPLCNVKASPLPSFLVLA